MLNKYPRSPIFRTLLRMVRLLGLDRIYALGLQDPKGHVNQRYKSTIEGAGRSSKDLVC